MPTRLPSLACPVAAVLFSVLLSAPVSSEAEDRLSAASPRDAADFASTMPPASCRREACVGASEALAAGDPERAAELLAPGGAVGPLYRFDRRARLTETLLRAVAHERSGAFLRAAHDWEVAAVLAPGATQYFHYRALGAQLARDEPRPEALERLVHRGALDHPFERREFRRLRTEAALHPGPPAAPFVRRALVEGERGDVCPWLAEQLRNHSDADAPRQLFYGHCLDEDLERSKSNGDQPLPYPESPSDRARVDRAERLYAAVRYEDAVAEIEQLDLESLEPEQACRARFRWARSLYRLDREERAAEHYRRVVDDCEAEATANPHIRSLYGLGRWHFRNRRHEKSAELWRRLVETYPERSHADDALLYLGRISRRRGERDREKELLARALDDYPEGDMVAEFAWEYLERWIEERDWETFLARSESLALPEYDDEPHSQGRIAYFRGVASRQLERPEQARDEFERVWGRYPFSFYGLLAHLRLREMDAPPTELGGTAARRPPDWFFGRTPARSTVRLLADLGLWDAAADLVAGRANAGDNPETGTLWRLASLRLAAGDPVLAHETPRRRIPKPPWVAPERGRVYRWHVAYPAAFSQTVNAAAREMSRRRSGSVAPELVAALMREESGFRPKIVSWAGAVGLMQLMPATAEGLASVVDGEVTPERLENPRVNVRIGTAYLASLAGRFDNHPAAIVAAYNAGGGAVSNWLGAGHPARVDLWVESIPYRQTRHYVKRLLGSYAAYQWLAGHPLDSRVAEPVH